VVECVVAFPHLLCGLIQHLSTHCAPDAALAERIARRFSVLERLVELQINMTTAKHLHLFQDVPIPDSTNIEVPPLSPSLSHAVTVTLSTL
jgi:hypothetical protein